MHCRVLTTAVFPFQGAAELLKCVWQTDNKATPNDDDDDGSLLGAVWWMRIDVTHVELYVCTCVFVYERRQTIPQAK